MIPSPCFWKRPSDIESPHFRRFLLKSDRPLTNRLLPFDSGSLIRIASPSLCLSFPRRWPSESCSYWFRRRCLLPHGSDRRKGHTSIAVDMTVHFSQSFQLGEVSRKLFIGSSTGWMSEPPVAQVSEYSVRKCTGTCLVWIFYAHTHTCKHTLIHTVHT